MTVPSLSADKEFDLGMGGEYLLNPKTNKRTLITRTAPAPTPTELPDAIPDAQADNSDQG
jgi:hypothetical protein